MCVAHFSANVILRVVLLFNVDFSMCVLSDTVSLTHVCVVNTMFLLNKKQTLGFFGVEKKINLFFLKVFKKKTSRHIFFVNVSKKICFFRYIT